MLTLTVISYQLMLPIPDLDAVSQYEAGVVFEAILTRAFHDLRLAGYRKDALAFFEGGECRRWCEVLGLQIAPLLERVEVEMDKPILWRRQKPQA